ncbi:hypothetical protein FB451DRAFT_161586 [Mycena latifolia]|nr:hypothetical protein FB451DRAFT_161586 [Mycena latifolia]
MASPLMPTFGMWLVALFLESILFGMGLVQVYLYFFWYHEDTWKIKGTVRLRSVLETFQTVTFFVLVYNFLVVDFGDFDRLAFIPWQAITQLLAGYTSTFVAQTYFAYCIYLLNKKENAILPAIIFLNALAAFAGGITHAALSAALRKWSDLPKTSTASTTEAALSLSCDILITAGLCWRLNSAKSGVQSTNNLLNFLIMTAINRGVTTMLTALMNIILFWTRPGTFYFMLMLLISGKLYMNSMLAMLNTRRHAHSLGFFANPTIDLSMPEFPPDPRHRQNLEEGISISVTMDTHRDTRDGKAVF